MTDSKFAPFQPFTGVHCETVATGTLLKAAGIEISEPMLFGLGEALGFVFLNLATLPLPFVGGRSKPFELTTRLCRNLGVPCRSTETKSRKKAWEQLEGEISRGRPAGLQLDCYYLDYFKNAPHFAGHFVAACGMDASSVLLVDMAPQGSLQRVPRASLEAARHATGPMSASARMWVIEPPDGEVAVGPAAHSAMRANAAVYLSPSFAGMSYLGIEKLAKSLPNWLKLATDPERDLPQAAMLMERAGTGGSLFRNLFRDFLAEAGGILPNLRSPIGTAHGLFATAATEWRIVAELIERAGADRKREHLENAAGRCRGIAALETSAMRVLADI